MGRPRKITDAELLEATRSFIQERGLQISSRDLAKQVGISEGVLFQRFGTKERLIRAALALPQIQVDQLVAEASTGNDSRAVLENIAVAIFVTFRKLLPFYVPLLSNPSLEREVWTSRNSPIQMFVDALEQHLKSERHAGRIWTESPHTTAYCIVSALHAAVLLQMIDGDSENINEGTARDFIGVIWSGLKPHEQK